MAGFEFAAVEAGERDLAIGALVSAFADDPVERWLYPEADAYRRRFPAFVRAFGGDAFRDHTVWRLGDFAAVAFWFRPSREPDGDAVGRVLEDTVDADRHADAFATLEQMAAGHPVEPHWYLPWFGVERALQGRGLGSVLLSRCLERVDADSLPAYLETPNPRSVPFYERSGFRTTGVAGAGACPPITLMWRPAGGMSATGSGMQG